MERRFITIEGIVQGVGFRPFIYELASQLHLKGSVRNDGGSVFIDIEGGASDLDHFIGSIQSRPPPLARIDRIDWRPDVPCGRKRFEIETSQPTKSPTVSVSPDVATCADCLRELSDPRDRRYRYPFINCTNCGPRLTIIQGAPYDRQRTTMSGFPMCAACRREYENPQDRRFHAEPIACAVCGPRLGLLDARGIEVRCEDPLAAAVDAVREGKVVAIKGLGGFHLACDAANESAVRELRLRKHRDEKPFAVMTQSAAATEEFCELNPEERELLESRSRPIVLLHKRKDIPPADAVAPGNPFLGVMLPYTPMHHLLLHELAGTTLVMTSGNRSDEPIAFRNEDVATLVGIADVFLTHDRPIHVRCDDSVMRINRGQLSPIRRSRGYAPQSINLPMRCSEPLLAVGGQLKNTFAIGRERQAILSHHLGDLDHFQAFRAFERDIELYKNVFATNPRIIVHDLHPDYASTKFAKRVASDRWSVASDDPQLATDHRPLATIPVQHHHAHIAACMAEHGLDETVIGVSFDGTGYGTDGAIWGGEFLVCDYAQFERAAHLRYIPMPGGDRAIREPWRMAMSHLLDANADCNILRNRIDSMQWRTCEQMIAKHFNAPLTSSAGRLFDAVASLIGLRDAVSYEAQAAMQLEWLASGDSADGSYPFEIDSAGVSRIIDTRPLIRAIVEDVSRSEKPARIARRFHTTMANVIVRLCHEIRRAKNLDVVVFSGGVFMNQILAAEASDLLRRDGFRVSQHRLVPTNDGGLSLGQIAVAAAQLRNGAEV